MASELMPVISRKDEIKLEEEDIVACLRQQQRRGKENSKKFDERGEGMRV